MEDGFKRYRKTAPCWAKQILDEDDRPVLSRAVIEGVVAVSADSRGRVLDAWLNGPNANLGGSLESVAGKRVRITIEEIE